MVAPNGFIIKLITCVITCHYFTPPVIQDSDIYPLLLPPIFWHTRKSTQ